MSTHSYIMRDQAKDIVAKLANFDATKPHKPKSPFRELVIFLFAALGYLLALGMIA